MDYNFQNKNESSYIENTNFFSRYLEIFDEVLVVARLNRSSKRAQNDYCGEIRLFGIRSMSILMIFDVFRFVKNLERPIIIRFPGVLSFFSLLALNLYGKKYYLEVVTNPDQECKAIFRKTALILCPIFKKISKYLIERSSFASFVTSSEIQQEFGLNENSTRYTYSSIDLEPFFYASREELELSKAVPQVETKKLLFVGQLNKNFKRLDRALELLTIVSNFELTVIGDGGLLEHYKHEVKTHGLKDKVRFVGGIYDRKELSSIYKSSDCMILVSEREGLPRVAIESMAIGLPIFALNVSGIRELISEKYIKNNTSELADVINKVMSNEAELRCMIKENRNTANRYDASLLKKRRNEFYSKVLDDFSCGN